MGRSMSRRCCRQRAICAGLAVALAAVPALGVPAGAFAEEGAVVAAEAGVADSGNTSAAAKADSEVRSKAAQAAMEQAQNTYDRTAARVADAELKLGAADVKLAASSAHEKAAKVKLAAKQLAYDVAAANVHAGTDTELGRAKARWDEARSAELAASVSYRAAQLKADVLQARYDDARANRTIANSGLEDAKNDVARIKAEIAAGHHSVGELKRLNKELAAAVVLRDAKLAEVAAWDARARSLSGESEAARTEADRALADYTAAQRETAAAKDAFDTAVGKLDPSSELAVAARELAAAQDAEAKAADRVAADQEARDAASKARDIVKESFNDASSALEQARSELKAAKDEFYQLHTAWSRFNDVKRDDWYIFPDGLFDYAIDHQIMSGYAGTGCFGPYDNITRGQVACVLWNMAGRPSTSSDAAQRFSDVDYGTYYGDAISWARATGVINGYGDTNTFRPDHAVERQELASMMRNYVVKIAGQRADASGSQASSVAGWNDVSDWAKDSMAWAYKAGLLSGEVVDAQGTRDLKPHNSAVRASAATMAATLYKMVTE